MRISITTVIVRVWECMTDDEMMRLLSRQAIILRTIQVYTCQNTRGCLVWSIKSTLRN